MELSNILSGDQITGRQAAIIFFGWLALVLTAGVIMLLITQNAI